MCLATGIATAYELPIDLGSRRDRLLALLICVQTSDSNITPWRGRQEVGVCLKADHFGGQ